MYRISMYRIAILLLLLSLALSLVFTLAFTLFYKEPFDVRKTVKQHEGDPFKYEQFSPCCCPSTYTSSQGCLCESLQIRALLGTRGGNRMLDPL